MALDINNINPHTPTMLPLALRIPPGKPPHVYPVFDWSQTSDGPGDGSVITRFDWGQNIPLDHETPIMWGHSYRIIGYPKIGTPYPSELYAYRPDVHNRAPWETHQPIIRQIVVERRPTRQGDGEKAHGWPIERHHYLDESGRCYCSLQEFGVPQKDMHLVLHPEMQRRAHFVMQLEALRGGYEEWKKKGGPASGTGMYIFYSPGHGGPDGQWICPNPKCPGKFGGKFDAGPTGPWAPNGKYGRGKRASSSVCCVM